MTKSKQNTVIECLQNDARTPIEDIARMIDTTPKEVVEIIQKLEKERVILQYTTVVSEEKVKSKKTTVRALIELHVRPEKKTGFGKIANRIARFPQVIDHYLISGNYDFLVVVEGKSLEEISTFVFDKLAVLENIQSTATHFILKKYKERGVVLDESLESERLPVTP